jgi:uncharacterized protein YndB with AHSA1/START domain
MTTASNTPATTADVPIHYEFSLEVPGTPDQVWAAIATAAGMSAWGLPTDLDERLGGELCFHMGPGIESRGTVSGWDPPHRLEITEPNWAELVGRPDAVVTPMLSEFLVEARSGGTCVVRVVTSAFGTGADWEVEFVADMERNWKPMFDNLRVYLAHFPGQHATPLQLMTHVPGSIEDVRAALDAALGIRGDGDEVTILGIQAQVALHHERRVVLRMSDPDPAMLVFMLHPADDGAASIISPTSAEDQAGKPEAQMVLLGGFVYGAGAPAYVERETSAWQAWLDGLAVTA